MFRRLLVVLLVAGVAFVAVRSGILNLSAIKGSPSSAAPAASASDPGGTTNPRPQPPVGRSLHVCADSTKSTDVQFAQGFIGSLADEVKGHLPNLPTDLRQGFPAIGGLEVTLRLVSTKPLAYGQTYVQVNIPAIAGLPPQPDLTAEHALDLEDGTYAVWKKQRDAFTTEYRAALQSRDAAVRSLNSVDLRVGRSGVQACAAALTTVAGAYPVTYVVASDLRDNASGQNVTAQFAGRPMLLVQPCPDGDQQKCVNSLESFSQWATSQGAGDISHVRPEAAQGALQQLITNPAGG